MPFKGITIYLCGSLLHSLQPGSYLLKLGLFPELYMLKGGGLPAAKFSQDMTGAGTATRKLRKWTVGQRASC